MKKTLLIAGMIAAQISMAAAKTINFDTPVKWNTTVIEQALNKAGFIGDGGANWDVRVTRNRILQDLLKRNSFSLHEAAQVCMDKCNLSDFLKKGKGASGKKCPELCKTFSHSFVRVVKSGAKSKSNTAQAKENYAKRVEKNGYCKEVITLDYDEVYESWLETQGGAHGVCRKHARKWAQAHACKLKSFGRFSINPYLSCFVNGVWGEWADESTPLIREIRSEKVEPAGQSWTYEYIPSYSDCVATFNDQDCANISKGQYK